MIVKHTYLPTCSHKQAADENSNIYFEIDSAPSVEKHSRGLSLNRLYVYNK